MDYVKCTFIIIIIITIVKHLTVVKFRKGSDPKLTTLECVYFF